MYFDYAATTPPNEEVLETYQAVNREFWANPHALYRPGLRADALMEQARDQVLTLLGAEDEYRCVFTSGATEANNMAIKGVARHGASRVRHLVTSAVEHPSVLEVFRSLGREGFDLTILPVSPSGRVDPSTLQQALRSDTTVVSLMHVNNEVGALNDIMALGKVVKERCNACFHVDAAQSVGKLPIQLDGSPVDLLSFSAHKFFGLKGAGALLLKRRMELPPLHHGGGQEAGFRSGTADAARAAAIAKALRLSLDTASETYERMGAYKQQIVSVVNRIEGVTLNGSLEDATPFIMNFSIDGVRPEPLLQALAEKEIYVSTVSACSARKTEESHVVFALTGSHERARSSIRISLSALTTQEEVEALCRAIAPAIASLRMERE